MDSQKEIDPSEKLERLWKRFKRASKNRTGTHFTAKEVDFMWSMDISGWGIMFDSEIDKE